MRKSTVRNGLRLVVIAMALILCASFYHSSLASLLSLSVESEMRWSQTAIFWGAAIGGYGVVLSVFGSVMAGRKQDSTIRIFPWFMAVVAIFFLFFYLLTNSFDSPSNQQQKRLRPGETITI